MIRKETLQPYGQHWVQPTGLEVRKILSEANLIAESAALYVGVSHGRTVRKWMAYDEHKAFEAKQMKKKINMQKIPYSAWAILAYMAGYGRIWEKN